MKNKFITLAVATIMFVMATTVTAFAATGTWNLSAEGWQFLDNDGDAQTDIWVKGASDWFYINSDGIMAVSERATKNDNLYFLGEDGAMVKNAWVFFDDEDFEEKWLFFDANGKAVKDGWKALNGKKYHFTDYAMDYGFLDADCKMIEENADKDEWKEATYYCGSNDDGAKYTGWLKVDDLEAEDGYAWIYFDGNGKKVTGKKVIDGVTYFFKDNGAMQVSWLASPSSLATPSSIDKYYDNSGKLIKKGWIWATADGDEDGDYHWFYANANGEIAKNVLKKINGKYYAFDEDGIMLTGFVKVDFSSKTDIDGGLAAEDIEDAYAKSEEVFGGKEYMYFTESANPMEQGAAVLGKTTIQLANGEYTFNFNKSGVAKGDGYKVVKNYLYFNDILVKDTDAERKYEAFRISGETTEYVINVETGKVYTKGTFTNTDEDMKFVFKDGEVYISVKKDNKWTTPVDCEVRVIGSPE